MYLACRPTSSSNEEVGEITSTVEAPAKAIDDGVINQTQVLADGQSTVEQLTDRRIARRDSINILYRNEI